MTTRRRAASALAALALVVLFGAPAVASAVAAGGPVDVQLWPQDGQMVVIASVELPTGTRLPAVVRIPVVTGSTVEWAGEIVGQDAKGDIPAQYKLVRGVGGQYAEFTLTKSLRGQIDAVASTLTVSGSVVSTKLDWVQSVTASETIFSVRVPPRVSDVKISPTPDPDPATNELGEALYLLPVRTLAGGEKITVTLSYNTAPASNPSSADRTDTIIIALVVVLAVVLGALALIVRRRTTA